MAAFLLDVNVLVALFWAEHEDHTIAQQWFKEHEKKGWATCPFTQAAFVRLVSNPAFSPDAVSAAEAIDLLAEALRRPTHEFWPDELSFPDAAAYLKSNLSGHKQITDIYLLGLAMHHHARLVTFDKPLASLLPAKARKADWILEVPRRIH